MAKFSRGEVGKILANEALSVEEKQERIFALYGSALDEGYVSKAQAAADKEAAVEAARKDFTAPDPKQSEEYKALQTDFDNYKTRTNARTSSEYADVKPKFFDAVYDKLDHSKPIKEQLDAIRKDYAEFFTEAKSEEQPKTPQFGEQTKGNPPTGEKGNSFWDAWGYGTKFNNNRKE